MIHGTNKPAGVGLRSSHGCIRLYPEDIAQLFEMAPVGTQVRVVNQPFVFGWHEGALHIQAFDVLEDDPRDWKKAQAKLLNKALAERIQKELKARKEKIDWEAVSQLSHEPRGIPVSVSGGPDQLDAIVASRDRGAEQGGAGRHLGWHLRSAGRRSHVPGTAFPIASRRWSPPPPRRSRRAPTRPAADMPASGHRTCDSASFRPDGAPMDALSLRWRHENSCLPRSCWAPRSRRTARPPRTPSSSAATTTPSPTRRRFASNTSISTCRLRSRRSGCRGSRISPSRGSQPSAAHAHARHARSHHPPDLVAEVARTSSMPLRFTLGARDPLLGTPLNIDLPAELNAAGIRGAHLLPDAAGSVRPAVGRAGADGRQDRSIPVLAVGSHPRAQLDPAAGLAAGAHDLRRHHSRASRHARGDERRAQGPGCRTRSRPTASTASTMPQAIPSYLIALGVGKLEFRATGPRTGVYAETRRPIAAAAHEFAETEQMIEVSEKLFGPYRWGRYDLLILPPSFPFGGMENPRLSFITPTSIAGDRSLTALIAHELAHSWSGNLVTNATLARPLAQRRLHDVSAGPHREARSTASGARRWKRCRTLDGLRKELATLPPADQILAIDLRGRDPDDVFSTGAVHQGRVVRHLAERPRSASTPLDEFLHDYFDHFAFQSISTEQFRAYLDAEPAAAEARRRDRRGTRRVDATRRACPKSAVLPQSDAFERVDAARKSWLAGTIAAADLPGQGMDHARMGAFPRRHARQGAGSETRGARRHVRADRVRQRRDLAGLAAHRDPQRLRRRRTRSSRAISPPSAASA